MTKRFSPILIILMLSGCAATREFFTNRFLPGEPAPIVVEFPSCSLGTIRTEVITRFKKNRWHLKETSPNRIEFTQEMKGFFAWLFYQSGSNKSKAKYVLEFEEADGGPKAIGQFLLIRKPLAKGEIRGGRPHSRLRNLLEEIKEKCPPKTAKQLDNAE